MEKGSTYLPIILFLLMALSIIVLIWCATNRMFFCCGVSTLTLLIETACLRQKKTSNDTSRRIYIPFPTIDDIIHFVAGGAVLAAVAVTREVPLVFWIFCIIPHLGFPISAIEASNIAKSIQGRQSNISSVIRKQMPSPNFLLFYLSISITGFGVQPFLSESLSIALGINTATIIYYEIKLFRVFAKLQ